MKQQTNVKELKREFLEAIANQYDLSLKYKKVLIARFDDNTTTNSELADGIGITSQDFQDYLGEICKKLGFPSIGRGRSRKGESPWEKTYKWLWSEKFNEFQQTTVNTSSQAEAKVLIHRQTFQDKLTQQRRLTSNSLTSGDGITFGTKDIYVPLGLIERKLQPLIGNDFSPEQGSKLYEPTEYEVTRRLENTEFFDLVLKQGQTPKSHGKRIAVIGEPGAGKTTLLQQIANWVFDNNDTDVAIWISLADLQEKTIEEYLLGVWLKDACKSVRVSVEMEEALAEMFNKGRVWLLLDGVDEMSVNQSNPLTDIFKQLQTGWVSNARVVLTCRLNVWDAGKNALEGFDAYRTLEFDYGDNKQGGFDKVNEFITRWFTSSEPQLGISLRAALEQPGKERIKDLVKNPLRLTLMCASWQRRQGELPETKAALYRRFVETFYQWKEEYIPTSSETRRELNQALGKLAVNAISQFSSRFRLTYSYVSSFLGERDTPLFQLATQIGWLNQVGVAQEDPDEPVYAFYHPTFQEYFAACVIDNWDFFFNHVPENPDLGTYHIFEPQWKEVILLWFGRENINNENKEEFIKALIKFEDGCQNVYSYQSFFLAAIGIAEFKECVLSDEILSKLIKYAFGQFDEDMNIWITYSPVISEKAKNVLNETNTEKVIPLIIEVIQSTQYEHVKILAADKLGQLKLYEKTVVESLVNIIKNTTDEKIRYLACNALKQFEPRNLEVTNKLSTLAETTDDLESLALLKSSLESIDDSHPSYFKICHHLNSLILNKIFIANSIEIMEEASDLCREHDCLDQMDEILTEAIFLANNILSEYLNFVQLLFNLMPNQHTMNINDNFITIEKDRIDYKELIKYLNELSTQLLHFSRAWRKGGLIVSNENIIYLEEYLTSENILLSLFSALIIGKITPEHKGAINKLTSIIIYSSNEINILIANYILSFIKPTNNIVISSLDTLLDKYRDDESNLIIPTEFTLINLFDKIINNNLDDNTFLFLGIIILLFIIEPSIELSVFLQYFLVYDFPQLDTLNIDCQIWFSNLIQLLSLNLGKAKFGDEVAIAALIKIIIIAGNSNIQTTIYNSLQKIAKGDQTAIYLLRKNYFETQNNDTRQIIFHHLGTILDTENSIELVKIIREILTEKACKNINIYFNYYSLFINCNEKISLHINCYSLLFKCAENISYQNFYDAWHRQIE